jgi:hypothetical protein
MPTPSSIHTTKILEAFKTSWGASIKAYKEKRLNSERCLQANLFHFLTKNLGKEFQIFVEATVRIPQVDGTKSTKKVLVDTIVCCDDVVYAAIELKYSPKGQSRKTGIRKDLASLSHIKNRRSVKDKLVIEMPRYRNPEGDVKKLTVDKSVRLIFAAFLRESGSRTSPSTFWIEHRPAVGRWAGKRSIPPRLGVAIAQADEEGTATPLYFGSAFDETSAHQRKRSSSGA